MSRGKGRETLKADSCTNQYKEYYSKYRLPKCLGKVTTLHFVVSILRVAQLSSVICGNVDINFKVSFCYQYMHICVVNETRLAYSKILSSVQLYDLIVPN
jgi:hypothetical protein